MPTSSPAESRCQASLSAVSIDDYEVLIAPREAFVNFLLGPRSAVDRTGAACPSPSAV